MALLIPIPLLREFNKTIYVKFLLYSLAHNKWSKVILIYSFLPCNSIIALSSQRLFLVIRGLKPQSQSLDHVEALKKSTISSQYSTRGLLFYLAALKTAALATRSGCWSVWFTLHGSLLNYDLQSGYSVIHSPQIKYMCAKLI